MIDLPPGILDGCTSAICAEAHATGSTVTVAEGPSAAQVRILR
jgi:hypothetical protein